MDQFLQRKCIRTCRYQGDRNISEREQAIRVLKKSKKCRVMLRESCSRPVLLSPSGLMLPFFGASLSQVRRSRLVRTHLRRC